jgi:hypothetical protein
LARFSLVCRGLGGDLTVVLHLNVVDQSIQGLPTLAEVCLDCLSVGSQGYDLISKIGQRLLGGFVCRFSSKPGPFRSLKRLFGIVQCHNGLISLPLRFLSVSSRRQGRFSIRNKLVNLLNQGTSTLLERRKVLLATKDGCFSRVHAALLTLHELKHNEVEANDDNTKRSNEPDQPVTFSRSH